MQRTNTLSSSNVHKTKWHEWERLYKRTKTYKGFHSLTVPCTRRPVKRVFVLWFRFLQFRPLLSCYSVLHTNACGKDVLHFSLVLFLPAKVSKSHINRIFANKLQLCLRLPFFLSFVAPPFFPSSLRVQFSMFNNHYLNCTEPFCSVSCFVLCVVIEDNTMLFRVPFHWDCVLEWDELINTVKMFQIVQKFHFIHDRNISPAPIEQLFSRHSRGLIFMKKERPANGLHCS